MTCGIWSGLYSLVLCTGHFVHVWPCATVLILPFPLVSPQLTRYVPPFPTICCWWRRRTSLHVTARYHQRAAVVTATSPAAAACRYHCYIPLPFDYTGETGGGSFSPPPKFLIFIYFHLYSGLERHDRTPPSNKLFVVLFQSAAAPPSPPFSFI